MDPPRCNKCKVFGHTCSEEQIVVSTEKEVAVPIKKMVTCSTQLTKPIPEQSMSSFKHHNGKKSTASPSKVATTEMPNVEDTPPVEETVERRPTGKKKRS